jgi:hypothetical protein
VVVAYAFRDHWMWFNGYSYLGRTFSFIIWKDYNCVTWNAVDNSVISGSSSGNAFGTTMLAAYRNIALVNPYIDIWTFGSSLLN